MADHSRGTVHLDTGQPVTFSPPGVSAELAAARMKAAFGLCSHPEPVGVRTVTNELVAWLCPPPCDTELPAEWKESDDGR